MTAWIMLATALLAAEPGGESAKPRSELRCGAYCLYTSLRALDFDVGSFDEFEETIGQPNDSGFSMEELARVVDRFGGHSIGVLTNLHNLEGRSGRFACIALLEQDRHFVCIYDIDEMNVYLIDPPVSRVASRDAFSIMWEGKALLISNQPLSLYVPTKNYLLLAVVIFLPIAGLLLFFRRRYRTRVSPFHA